MSNAPNEPDPTHAPWWQKGVVYQVYPRSFMDSNGDGVGDLDGITSRLPYLSDLGIDAIWLSPFYKSPMADFGYDVADYCDVDPIFGDLAAFDRLLAEAHRRHIRLIVDFVPNHTSDQHPWFLESRSSRDNPKRDWYIWRDPKPDGSPPNNWLALFGGGAWEFDEKTGQYYLHSFLKEQPDLNWRHPGVKAAMLDALRFWLERGVDGFRIDVAHFIMKDPDLRDNPMAEASSTHRVMGDYSSQKHIYDIAHPDVHGVYRDIRKLLDEYSQISPRYSVGEIHIFDWDAWAMYYGRGLDELHMPFNFGLVNRPWDARGYREIVDGVEAALAKLPPGAWPNYVLGNHDEPRIGSRVGPSRARAAMMLLLTLRGTPTMYYGDEIGMTNVPIPPEKEQDPFGKRVKGENIGRDPERTPMQWDSAPNAGFAAPGVEPWLPIADNYQTVNVAAQESDPHSMLSFTRRLLGMRREFAALNLGRYRPVEGTPLSVFAYEREHSGVRYLIAINFGSDEVTVQLDGDGRGATGRVLLSTLMDRDGAEGLASFRIRGNEGCVIALGG